MTATRRWSLASARYVRRTPTRMIRRPLVIVLAAAFAGAIGCAAKKHLSEDEYYSQATQDFRAGALSLSIDEYHDLLDQYPFTQHAEEAELRIAQAQYLAGNYAESIVSLTDFQRRHPTSPNLPFVGYYLGMCYVQQIKTIDRDQSAAANAQTYFMTVSQQYPDSPFAELAREQLARCRRNLAEHELYIAAFYSKRGNRKAAEVRLLTLAARYPETPTAADGLLRLGSLYRRDSNSEQAALAYRALTALHPSSRQAAVARRALEHLTVSDGDDSGDPLDRLLALNGRQRSTGTFETVQVPGLEPSRGRSTAAAAPALMPPLSPFGRGGRPY